MTLLDETRSDLGTVTAQPLALNQTSRRWEPNGATFEASILDLSGRETYALGRPIDTEMVRMFTDYTSAGALPVGIKGRVRIEGKDWQVLGAKRVPKEQDEAGCIYDLQRIT